jgi:hypothetical protein
MAHSDLKARCGHSAHVSVAFVILVKFFAYLRSVHLLHVPTVTCDLPTTAVSVVQSKKKEEMPSRVSQVIPENPFASPMTLQRAIPMGKCGRYVKWMEAQKNAKVKIKFFLHFPILRTLPRPITISLYYYHFFPCSWRGDKKEVSQKWSFLPVVVPVTKVLKTGKKLTSDYSP